jgi:hypothetical protein
MSKMLSVSVVALALLWLASPMMAADVGKGNILMEEWFTQYTGSQVNNDVTTLHTYINAGNAPSRSYWAQALDRPDGGEDYWGGRMRGYLYPPQTGDYTFWTASDDDSEVWLSTSEDPTKATMICNVEGWLNYQDWTYTSGAPGTTYKSKAIKLEAGKKYYIDVFFSDGTGGGFDTVAWGGPGIGAGPVVVAGKYLAPWIRDPEPMFMAQTPNPVNGAVGVASPLMTWTAGVTAMWHDVYFGTDPANLPLVSPRTTWLMYYNMTPLVPGTTYYWKVNEIEVDGTTVREGPVWKFTAAALGASGSSPRNGDMWINTDATLTWIPGMNAMSHAVYFGTDKNAVTNRAASVSKGSQPVATFTPAGLTANTTYYWAVDETNLMGVKTAGDVWSFTTKGPGLGVKGEYFNSMSPTGVPALVRVDPQINFTFGDPGGPGAPIGVDNFSARWTADLQIIREDTYTFIVNCDDGARLWLNGQLIVDTWVDQSASDHVSTPMLLKPGTYGLRMEYYENTGGATAILLWTNSLVTRQVIPEGPLQLPLKAKPGYPQSGDVNVPQDTILTWSAGEKAAKHAVYFGLDKDAVTNATTASTGIYQGTQAKDAMTFAPGTLEWNTTYYWRVDEVNDGTAGSPWTGSVWSFTTANCIVVDNFEGYDDDANRIYDTWLDNYDPTGDQSGSVVGNDPAPFAEQTIVRAGRQSMPMTYNNAGPKHLFSETVRTFGSPQNWTVNGVTDLSLWVRGYPTATSVAVTETAGKMSLAGGGADIWGTSDQFTFAYKTLSGDGTMIARVVSIGAGSNTWAKGGVMIRDNLNGNSASVQIALTANSDGGAGNGAVLQNRATAGLDMGANDATSNTASATVIAPPYWVKLERKGDTFTGSLSTNGTNWTILGTADVVMKAPVYIGMFVTSHQAGEQRTYNFESISSTGGVSGSWQGAVIASPMYNDPAGLYVTVEDSSAKKFTQSNATAVNSATWVPVKFPLSGFTGVNLAKVKKLSISVGDPKTTVPDGAGKIFIDDIFVTKP